MSAFRNLFLERDFRREREREVGEGIIDGKNYLFKEMALIFYVILARNSEIT